MGKSYEQLSYRERLAIADGVRQRLSVRAIARTLKRSPTTISREVKRNCELRAGLAARAVDWPWSSLHAHLGGVDDGITAREPMMSRYPDFAGLLAAGEDEERVMRLRKAGLVGRPIGDAAFLERFEGELGRSLKPGRPGPKPKSR